MATLRPDPDLLAAIRRHMGAWHDRGIQDAEIAPERKGRLARATKVTFRPETAQEPAWFTCRLCPEGARRYRADLYASPGRPPPRHVAAIQRHFAERHAHPNLSPRRIYRQPSSEKRALAVYLPANMNRGAGFIWPFRFQWGERVRIRGAWGRVAGQSTPPAWSSIRSR